MLHAITQRKTKIHQRYLGFREEDERRIPAEDELTALLLGPLSFIQEQDMGRFWKSIVDRQDWPQGDVESATMHFWDRRKQIEPDLRVDLQWPDGTRRVLLVELKWRSGLSGERQLHDQWEHYLYDHERPDALHLFIAPRINEALQALAQDDVWKGRLLPRSWQQLLGQISSLDQSPSGLQRLITQLKGALAALQIQPFNGFSQIPALLPAQINGPVFWCGITERQE